MSFDLSFLWCNSNPAPSHKDIEEALNFEGAANLEEQVRMRHLAESLVSTYEGAEWNEAEGGLARGAWVGDGPLPDIDIGPRAVFMSTHPDPSNPDDLAFFTGILKFFEARGYICFDHQRGEVIAAEGFTFG